MFMLGWSTKSFIPIYNHKLLTAKQQNTWYLSEPYPNYLSMDTKSVFYVIENPINRV